MPKAKYGSKGPAKKSAKKSAKIEEVEPDNSSALARLTHQHKTTTVKLATLVEDPDNTRVHPERNLEEIKRSLMEYGQVEPLIVQKSSNRVIGGNGRLAVLRELGMETANVILLDIDDLSARKLSVALNRTAELATWDFDRLEELLRLTHEQAEDEDVGGLIGWSEDELAAIMNANEWEGVPDDGVGAGMQAVNYTLRVLDQSRADEAHSLLKAFIAKHKDLLSMGKFFTKAKEEKQ